jgi:hypothetical protein
VLFLCWKISFDPSMNSRISDEFIFSNEVFVWCMNLWIGLKNSIFNKDSFFVSFLYGFQEFKLKCRWKKIEMKCNSLSYFNIKKSSHNRRHLNKFLSSSLLCRTIVCKWNTVHHARGYIRGKRKIFFHHWSIFFVQSSNSHSTIVHCISFLFNFTMNSDKTRTVYFFPNIKNESLQYCASFISFTLLLLVSFKSTLISWKIAVN